MMIGLLVESDQPVEGFDGGVFNSVELLCSS
jgi:hypothetical protein